MDDTDRAEVARLRESVDNLAARLGAAPGHLMPDRVWRGHGETHLYSEWDVAYYAADYWGRRQLAVRAGWPDGTPRVFLVDSVGDMFCLEIRDAHRLIAAVSAAITHATDDVARQRALITGKDKPCSR